MQLKDLDVGKIVFKFGHTSRVKILSDQANWSQRVSMKPVQMDWALGVLVQTVDPSGNPFPDKRSKPFATELRNLMLGAVNPHTC